LEAFPTAPQEKESGNHEHWSICGLVVKTQEITPEAKRGVKQNINIQHAVSHHLSLRHNSSCFACYERAREMLHYIKEA
jgi:hypothetical protein